MQGHLTGLLKCVKTLKRKVARLQYQKTELSEELATAREQLDEAVQPKRGSKGRVTAKDLQKKLSEMKTKVRDLEKVGTSTIVTVATND